MDSDMDRLVRFYYRTRHKWRHAMHMVFPSPLELEFIELMGGRVIRFDKIKLGDRVVRLTWLRQRRTNFPPAIVMTLGAPLRSQNVRREIRYGKYFVDFANDLHRIIELDGKQYHMDVVADLDREIAIKKLAPDARFMRIRTYQLRNQPKTVRAKVIKFLDLEIPSKKRVHGWAPAVIIGRMYKKIVQF